MAKTEFTAEVGQGEDLGASVPLIYADKISGIEFGPGVTKIRLSVEGGRDISVIVLPTLGFVEILEKMYPEIKSKTALRDLMSSQLDLLKSKFGPA